MALRIYDYECRSCGIFEDFGDSEKTSKACPGCGQKAKRIVSIGNSAAYLGNQDAPWIRSVLDVVDKESTKPHVRAFIENPNRENYKRWMKGEGIRPVDYTVHGGPPVREKPPEPDRKAMVDYLYKRHRERKTIEVRG
jgi:putative FmdB family regulatory protein